MFCYFQLPTYMKSQDRFNVSFWFCSAQSLESSLNLLFQIKMMVIFTIFLTSYGEGNGNPLQYSCLENPMDRGAWWATVHGVTKSRTRLSDFCVCVCVCVLPVITRLRALQVASGKECACQCRRHKRCLSREDPLEDGMAIHSCIHAWRIPWTEKPGGLQSTRLKMCSWSESFTSPTMPQPTPVYHK